MNIPESHRSLIEQTYDGICTIYKVTTTTNEYGANKNVYWPTVTGQPCRLSYKMAGTASTGNTADVSQTATLFIAPEVDIPEGCKLSITQYGHTTEWERSGPPSYYPSHQQVPLALSKEHA